MKSIYELKDLQVIEYEFGKGLIDTVMIGVLYAKPEAPANGKWKKFPVTISPLLRYRIENNKLKGLRNGANFTSRFVSDNLSPSFSDCPYRISHFQPDGDSDIPENYKLELVNEKLGVLTEITDMFSNKEERWDSKSVHPSKWMRYVIQKVSKKLSECKDDFVVLTPDSCLVTKKK